MFGLRHEAVINLNSSSEIDIEVFYHFHNIYKNLIVGCAVLVGLGMLTRILEGIIVLIFIFPMLFIYNILEDSLLILIKE